MILVKIGGGKHINIEGIAKDLKIINHPAVILHGANHFRDDLALKVGYQKRVVKSTSGVSSVYSDKELIDLMLMSYAGLRNKRIVEKLQQEGINGIGLSGIDGAVLKGRKNQGVRIVDNGKKKILRDLSGKIIGINKDLLNLLLEHDYTPVLTIPILDENGMAINSENDDILVELASELNPDTIISLIEAPGILQNPQIENSLIPVLTQVKLSKLSQEFTGRIQRKLIALQRLSNVTSASIRVADGRIDAPIRSAMKGSGTTINSNIS